MEEKNRKILLHANAKPELFRFAQLLRGSMTDPEKKLWEYLKHKPMGYKFRRQHPFSLYILDFYCHKLKMAIEIDGEYHKTTKQKMLDASRTAHLSSFGLFEFRYSNVEVLNNTNDVIASIESHLSNHKNRPESSHRD